MGIRKVGPLVGLAGLLIPAACNGHSATTNFGKDDPGIHLDDSGEGDDDDAGTDDDASDDGVDADAPPSAERAQLRRLTRSQYGNTLRDLLGDPLTLPDALEPDLVVELFDTVGAAQGSLSTLGTEQFEAAAEDAIDEVFADTARRSALVGCDPTAGGCFEQLAEQFGRRVFRRPLQADEIERYAALGSEVAALRSDPWQGARAIAVALLSAPSFLYLVELGEPHPDDDARWRFTSLEMASRLSYAIWNGPPDDALLTAAEDDRLLSADDIREQVERMLADDRARRGVGRFAAQWLGLDLIPKLDKDMATFPNATPELLASMHGETTRLVEHAALSAEGSILDLIAGDYTFVDATLASHYGIAPPTDVDAGGFGRVDSASMDGRTGILGTAGILASTSRRTRTAPTIRGLFVQERLRCQAPPPPPPDVEMEIPDGTEEEPQDQSIRELLEEHRENPVCAACHDTIDPPGLALEHFDAMGSYRTTDAGQPIDASTVVDGVEIDGLSQLAAGLRDDPTVRRCVVQQLYRFSTGHKETVEEAQVIEDLAEKLAEVDDNLSAFLPELMLTVAFRTLAPPA